MIKCCLSAFSLFFHNVFKSSLSWGRKKSRLCGKVLRALPLFKSLTDDKYFNWPISKQLQTKNYGNPSPQDKS